MPNKAPEPTPGLVTPRALECGFELNRWNGNRDVARAAPSPVVAHLWRWAKKMIAKAALLLFGWRRVPAHLAQRFADYIPMYLRGRKVKSHMLKKDCLVALAGVAFESARKGSQENPRFAQLVREVERISDVIAFARNVDEISDQRVRSILKWHGVELPLDATAYLAR